MPSHLRYTSVTPQLRHSYATATPQLHHSYTTAKPPLHRRYTTVTPPSRTCRPSASSARSASTPPLSTGLTPRSGQLTTPTYARCPARTWSAPRGFTRAPRLPPTTRHRRRLSSRRATGRGEPASSERARAGRRAAGRGRRTVSPCQPRRRVSSPTRMGNAGGTGTSWRPMAGVGAHTCRGAPSSTMGAATGLFAETITCDAPSTACAPPRPRPAPPRAAPPRRARKRVYAVRPGTWGGTWQQIVQIYRRRARLAVLEPAAVMQPALLAPASNAHNGGTSNSPRSE